MKLSRTSKRVLDDLRDLAAGLSRARTFGLAAEVSFWLFLALIPLAAVAGFVTAKLAVHTDEQVWLGNIPPSARDLVAAEAGRVAAWHGSVAPVAIVIFVWLASNGVHAIFEVLEVQTGTHRPWWKKRAISLVTCVGLSLATAGVGLMLTGIDWVARLTGHLDPRHLLPGGQTPPGHVGGTVARGVLGAALWFLLTMALYRVGIPRRTKVWPLAPGAALAVTLQVLLGAAYGLYIAKVGKGDAYLAGLAVIGVTMMTLYLFSVALLVGVQLNNVIGRRRRRDASSRDAYGGNMNFTSSEARPT